MRYDPKTGNQPDKKQKYDDVWNDIKKQVEDLDKRQEKNPNDVRLSSSTIVRKMTL